MTGRNIRVLAGSSFALALLTVQPASAQNFLDNIFGGGNQQQQPAQPAPAQPAPAGQKGAKPPNAKPTTAAAKPAARPTGTPVSDPNAVVEKANAYFNGFQSLTGGFVQTGPDGRRIGGKLYLVKPGRLRFEYDQPSPLEVVADGTSVAVRDRKMNTQDLYFINQTPLKFLLRERINLAGDLSVTDVSADGGGYRISLEDRSTFGGTSRIQLFFDNDFKTLTQWRITDPQGYNTTVQLSGLQPNKAISGIQFFIDYGRSEDKAMRERIQRGQANAQ